MKKKVILTLALLGAATVQAANDTSPANVIGVPHLATQGAQIPLSTSPIVKTIETAIKHTDPKNPVNVAKAHALRATALNTIGNSAGILAPKAQNKLIELVNALETSETLFIISCFLMSLLHHVNHYRVSYHHGATVHQAASTVPTTTTAMGHETLIQNQAYPASTSTSDDSLNETSIQNQPYTQAAPTNTTATTQTQSGPSVPLSETPPSYEQPEIAK